LFFLNRFLIKLSKRNVFFNKDIFGLKVTSGTVLIFFLLFVKSNVSAQNKYFSQQLDNSAGLSNSCLNVIYQDSDNLMWFGTWDGLNMYDGSSFHVFNYSQSNTTKSIGSNIIYQIKEDNNKNIWIATIEGISRYNKFTGDFKHFFYSKNVNNKVVDKGFLLERDAEGIIYGASKFDLFLNYYDTKTQTFKKCNLPQFKQGKISKIIIDYANRLWIVTEGGGLQVYQKQKEKFTKIKNLKLPINIVDVYSVKQNIFFTTSSKQLFKANEQLDFKQVAILPHAIKAITAFKDSYILAWSSGGLDEYNTNFKSVNNLSKELESLRDVKITSLVGSQNILWIGTDGSGVVKISEKQNYFGLVKQLPRGGKINIPIRAFNEIDNQLWIGTKGNGIITINNLGKTNASSDNIKIFNSVSDLLDNCVYSIQKGKDNFVYVGSDALGVTLYDLQQKKWYTWNNVLGNYKYAPFNSVHSILIDQDSSVWLGLETYGLIHLKLGRNKSGEPNIQYLRKYPYTGNRFGPGNNVIYTLENGNNNQLYVGCRYGGLSIFNKKTKTFRTINAFSYKNSLSNNDVLALYKDKSNKLWIGTSYGLNYIDEKDLNTERPVFNKITNENGLPNNTVHTITQDNEGFIWASTNKGLVKIDPKSLKIVRFKESDGLQSNEFSDNAVWKNSDGYLFFGGIYGFNYFLPKNIKTNNFQPNLLLSEIQMAGLSEDEELFSILNLKVNSNNKDYVLAPGDNYFELRVKAIDFASSEKCQYAYFLEGNDKVWHYLGEDNKITYSNITPGNYTLKVKWSNGSGVWTNEVVAFQLKFKQYFWLTWIAFLGYFVIVASGLYIFFIYRRNKVKLQYELSMEHMLREKDEEVHQEQLNFFTNIAHELQTPLTLILGSLERYFLKSKADTKQGHHYFLSIVNQQASRLNYLVYQLLEFRKAEAGHLKNQYSFVNISKLLTNISELFSQLNDQSKFNYSANIEPEIEIWVDKDKLEKVIFNLLSNAFKHTHAGNIIQFSVAKNSENQQLEIKVSNSGYDLSKEELSSLFDRFFVVDDTQQSKISSGIGLAFTRELVSLLNGSIVVSSENNWISFTVQLPLNYIPTEKEKLQDSIDKLDTPSYLLSTMALEQESTDEQTILKNNKQAVLNSVENQEKKSILIVEDEPSIRYLLKDILKDIYNVYEAENGKKALDIVRKITPNLIISDIMMPDMSGLEVCNIIKNTPETCHIPFIILSARGTIEQKNEGYEAGADAYIPKPFHSENLLLRIRKLLEYQQRLHDLFNKDQSPIKIPDVGMKDNDKEFLEQTIALIEEKMDDESLDAVYLQDKLGMSKANFYRKLKSLSNMTPSELIKSIRLQQATSLLKNSELTVSEIFYKTGFSNQSYFFREFKKKYNCSPAEYRANHKLPLN
jgi:signal transduction histidine kinase/DNA-binding response OmpR family regulator/ligand-binding sensor domain-containing protein